MANVQRHPLTAAHIGVQVVVEHLEDSALVRRKQARNRLAPRLFLRARHVISHAQPTAEPTPETHFLDLYVGVVNTTLGPKRHDMLPLTDRCRDKHVLEHPTEGYQRIVLAKALQATSDVSDTYFRERSRDS